MDKYRDRVPTAVNQMEPECSFRAALDYGKR